MIPIYDEKTFDVLMILDVPFDLIHLTMIKEPHLYIAVPSLSAALMGEKHLEEVENNTGMKLNNHIRVKFETIYWRGEKRKVITVNKTDFEDTNYEPGLLKNALQNSITYQVSKGINRYE